MNKFEEFEKEFEKAFPGAKCVKLAVTFITPDEEVVRVGLVREGCEDPDEEDAECSKCGTTLEDGHPSDLCDECEDEEDSDED